MPPATIRREFRAAHTVLAEEEVRGLVEQHYATGALRSVQLLRRAFNETYLLEAVDGTRHVARVNALRARGPSNLAYEVAFLTHAAARGAGVAQPVPTRAGGAGVALALPEGTRTLAVFRHVAGEPPESAGDHALTGAGLARLHAAGDDYRGPASRYRLDGDHLLRRPLAWLLEAPTLDAPLREAFTALGAELEAGLARHAGLAEVACHGDCHGGNNFIHPGPDGRPATSFFDFDDSGPGYLAYDLAVLPWSLLLRKGLAAPDEEARERWSAFLRGYREVRPLAQADLQAVPLFLAIRHVWLLGEYASRRHHWGSQALPAPWLRKQLPLARAWLALNLEA